eukprot:PhF_6_TR13021/c1_g1_i1/m.20649/K00655/plsC; 1-acyl-sn-glycerol-3-phosphate acyltransferase
MFWFLSILVGSFLIVPRICAMFFPRHWFAFLAVVHLISLCSVAFFVDKLRFVGVSRETTQGMCATLCSKFFGFWLWLCPQIRIEEKGSTVKWDDIPKGSYILTNHMCFFDALMLTSLFPLCISSNVKTVMKSSLAKLPIFGSMFDWCGHFPVFFKSSENDNFSVDKERQEKVMERLEAFVASKKGMLALCPEGVMNRDPYRLLPFRHGSFLLALKYKCPMYAMIHFGGQMTWPIEEKLGGRPAHVTWRLVKLDIDYSNPELTHGAVADECRLQMQRVLDNLLKGK